MEPLTLKSGNNGAEGLRQSNQRIPAKELREDVKFLSFEQLLTRDVKILRMAGLLSINNVFTDRVVKPTHWEAVVFAIGFVNVLSIVVFEMYTVVDVWGDDPDRALRSATASVSGFLVFVKGTRLLIWREEFRRLLRRVAVMWDDSKNRRRIRNEIMKTAVAACFTGKCYMVMVMALAISFALRPYMLLLQYYLYEQNTNTSYDYTQVVGGANYPSILVAKTMTKYLTIVTWQQIACISIILYWMSTEMVFAQLTAHMTIQFRVLHHDLEYVTVDDNDHNSVNRKEVIDRLCTIARRHRDLYMDCETIEAIYNPLIFLTMLITGVNLCLAAFRLQKEIEAQHWDEVAKSLSHVSTIIVQAFIYCSYADTLTEQSSQMAGAAYECQWTDRSKEFNIILQIIMIRSQRPFNCTAYGFFNVNLSQLTMIFKTAASYFTLLKTMA